MGRRYRLGIVYTDHVRLRLRTLWDAAVRIAYLALGSSGVRLRIDVPHQFLLRDAGNKLGSDHGSSMPSHSLDRNRAMAFPMTGRVAYQRAGHIGCSLAP